MDTEDIKARGGEERLHGGEGGWNGEIWGREKLGEWNVDYGGGMRQELSIRYLA